LIKSSDGFSLSLSGSGVCPFFLPSSIWPVKVFTLPIRSYLHPQSPLGPSYISSHSADVILSDIRPIKLQVDALRCINVLLDEFLYNVLTAARSLSTDKLRAGLLKVLPTSLGKDALLEAEVELRAYWDRTGPDNTQHTDDQGKSFHLQWSFEVSCPTPSILSCCPQLSYPVAQTQMRSIFYLERV
jgi:hypothetical protein